ncbi:MAG: hypothetical protein E7190_11830 [Erysipelotrichaceae bacterium]|nr:hypothetical protein [Erysipelotrichaceae bacterium]
MYNGFRYAMKLSKLIGLLEELRGLKGREYTSGELESDVFSCTLWHNGVPFDRPGNIYICSDPKRVKKYCLQGGIFNKHSIIFLALKDNSDPSPVHGLPLHIFIFRQGYNAYTLFGTIRSVFKDEKRAPEVTQILLNELYENRNLHHILSTASNIFENSVLLNDVTFNVIAKVYKTQEGNDILEKITGLGYIRMDTVDEMRYSNIFMQIRDSDKYLFSYQKSADKNWLFRSVHINHIPAADIAVISDNRPFRYIDLITIDQLSKILSIYMQKIDFFKTSEDSAFSYLMNLILEGSLSRQEIITERFQATGITLKDNLWCAAIDFSDPVSSRADLNYLVSQLSRIVPECRWIVYKGKGAALITSAVSTCFSEHSLNQLRYFVQENRLNIGVSEMFHNPSEIPSYYLQALHACRTILPSSRTEPVRFFSEVKIYYLVKQIIKDSAGKEFLYPPLLQLEAYDAEEHTELMETLKIYVFSGKSISASVKELNIHRNSLLYRLKRIQEITGISFDSGEDLFQIMLHFKIKEFSPQ